FVHAHAFGDAAAPKRELALWWVTCITLVTMVLELVVGYWSGSLALVADGWHMGTHALALGGAALAAHLSRRVHGSERFAIGALWSPHPIAYLQAIVVAVIGLMVNAACAWLLTRGGQAHGHAHGPQAHDHAHAHDAAHAHGHDHAHDGSPAHDAAPPARAAAHRPSAHVHHDHNYRAATLHVLADALTS